jgi:NAD(P)-dependent dehydrogenase (short-subunit alcohol dehydrogenase family)
MSAAMDGPYQRLNLEGRVIAITGGSGGIGGATAISGYRQGRRPSARSPWGLRAPDARPRR